MPKENPVIAFLNKMADLILLNLIFLLCCIPVVTIGPAITALYAVSLRSVRYGDGYVIQTFFRSFKQNFKQSFVVGMIGLLFVCLLVIDLFFWRNVGPAFMSVFMTVVSVCVGYLVFIVFLFFIALIKSSNFVSEFAEQLIGPLILLLIIVYFIISIKSSKCIQEKFGLP